MAKENWLIFLDTNVLLDFYRLPGESAGRQLETLEKHKDLLITGEQVRMEFLKHRQKVLLDAIKQLQKPKFDRLPQIAVDFQQSKMLQKHIGNAKESFGKVKEKLEAMLIEPGVDQVCKAVNRLLDNDNKLNLSRSKSERFDVRERAKKRFMLGYPPRKASDTSLGDAVNWEWIVECAKNSTEGHNVLIVSRDSDYGVAAADKLILNDWLQREFKERVSRNRKIELTNRLTAALKKLNEQIEEEDIQEERKLIKREFFINYHDQYRLNKIRDVLQDYFRLIGAEASQNAAIQNMEGEENDNSTQEAD